MNSIGARPDTSYWSPIIGTRAAVRGAAVGRAGSWTEYWDLYHPETRGRYYFGDGEHAGYLRAFLPSPQSRRNPVFDSWKLLAIGSGGEKNPELEERFEAQARQPRVVEAVLAVDELVRRLGSVHFGRAGQVDALAYLNAMERFGKTLCPNVRNDSSVPQSTICARAPRCITPSRVM